MMKMVFANYSMRYLNSLENAGYNGMIANVKDVVRINHDGEVNKYQFDFLLCG